MSVCVCVSVSVRVCCAVNVVAALTTLPAAPACVRRTLHGLDCVSAHFKNDELTINFRRKFRRIPVYLQ